MNKGTKQSRQFQRTATREDFSLSHQDSHWNHRIVAAWSGGGGGGRGTRQAAQRQAVARGGTIREQRGNRTAPYTGHGLSSGTACHPGGEGTVRQTRVVHHRVRVTWSVRRREKKWFKTFMRQQNSVFLSTGRISTVEARPAKLRLRTQQPALALRAHFYAGVDAPVPGLLRAGSASRLRGPTRGEAQTRCIIPSVQLHASQGHSSVKSVC